MQSTDIPHNSQQSYGYQFESIPGQYSHNPNYPYLDVYPNIYHPYDPITGEYIKPLNPLHPSKRYKNRPQNVSINGRIVYNEDQNDEQLLCSDCCRTASIPINFLTVSLIIDLVLIVLFVIIKYRFIDPKNSSKTTSVLIEEIVFILLFCAIFILIAIFIKYSLDPNNRKLFLSLIQCQTCNDTHIEDNMTIPTNNYINHQNYYTNNRNEQFV